jgi:HEAT repeat protein
MNTCCVGLLYLGMIALAAAPPRPQGQTVDEPDYQGKPLSHWVKKALSPNIFVHLQGRSALREMMYSGVADGAVPALTRALEDKDPCVRDRAATILYYFGRGPEAEAEVARLIKALKDKDALERFEAARSLGFHRPASKAALPALTAALKDADANVRREAAVTLGYLGPEGKAAIPVLLQVLKEEPDAGHFHYSDAAVALGVIGPGAKAAVPALVRLLREEKFDHIRDAVAYGLGRIGPEARAAVPALRKALHDSEWKVRVTAAIALWRVQRDAKTSLPVLIAALKADKATSEMREILRIVGEMGPLAKEAVPLLTTLTRSPELGESWHARQALKQIDPSARKR